MASFHGKAGKIVWDAQNGNSTDTDIQHVISWALDATADVAESTEMGAVNWKSYLAGFSDWTATVECNIDSAGTDIPYVAGVEGEGLGGGYEADFTGSNNDKVNLELWFTQAEGGGIVYGPGVCTGIAHSTDSQDVAKITYTFQGNGVIAFTTTEPSYA